MTCETCNPEKYHIYGQCPNCKRLCPCPLFDPEKMTLEEYLEYCEMWKKEAAKIELPFSEVKTSKWISIKDRLPKNGERILCYNGYIHLKEYDQGWHDGDYHWSGSRIGKISEVTHWMPLPDFPK